MGYVINARVSITGDGQLARCWLHVHPEQQGEPSPPPPVFSLELLVSRQQQDRHLSEEDAVAYALFQGAEWLRRHIAQLPTGKVYHLSAGAGGMSRPRIETIEGKP